MSEQATTSGMFFRFRQETADDLRRIARDEDRKLVAVMERLIKAEANRKYRDGE